MDIPRTENHPIWSWRLKWVWHLTLSEEDSVKRMKEIASTVEGSVGGGMGWFTVKNKIDPSRFLIVDLMH